MPLNQPVRRIAIVGTSYPFPDNLPDVQWKSESWFSHRACKDHTPCTVFGLY